MYFVMLEDTSSQNCQERKHTYVQNKIKYLERIEWNFREKKNILKTFKKRKFEDFNRKKNKKMKQIKQKKGGEGRKINARHTRKEEKNMIRQVIRTEPDTRF